MLEKLKNVKNEKELQELGYQIIYRSNKRKVGTNLILASSLVKSGVIVGQKVLASTMPIHE